MKIYLLKKENSEKKERKNWQNKKIDILNKANLKIQKELTDLKKSVQYHSGDVDEVNKKLKDTDRRVEEIN